jgi:hypothetical protein
VLSLRRAAAVIAALLALAVGVRTTLRRPDQRRQPTQATVLHPLVAAPIPAGSAVLLRPPLGVAGADRGVWLMEAAWQRPDLVWLAFDSTPSAARAQYCVAIGEPADISGWRVVTRVAGVAVLHRAAS